MEAGTREASQIPKLYDHPGAIKALRGNILDSLKQKMDLQLKLTLILQCLEDVHSKYKTDSDKLYFRKSSK
jgi:hypothetical protein